MYFYKQANLLVQKKYWERNVYWDGKIYTEQIKIFMSAVLDLYNKFLIILHPPFSAIFLLKFQK